MAENEYVGDPKRMPVYMGAAGSGGDLIYLTTGSATNVVGALTFAGVLDTTTAAGSYGIVETEGVFTFIRGDGTADTIEQGQDIYGSNATTVATAQVSTGSVIGLAWEQAAATTGSVQVYIKGMNSKLM